MTLHIFANILTPFGTAANNRAETEGNITTLQKLLWMGETHTTVSAEAIRFAFRRRLKELGLNCNRNWADQLSDIPEAIREQLVKAYKAPVKIPCGYFIDPDFAWYSDPLATGYADDDLLGFMSAEAAKEEAEGTEKAESTEHDAAPQEQIEDAEKRGKKGKGKEKKKGTANVRRAVLEVTRAVSLTPWAGDITFNAASPGATPSAQKKGSNPVPYGTEVHATRYQYGVALTPERLRDKSRAAKAVEALCNLGTVAGNHGRFLFDFSPDALVIRITTDPAPRLLYCFNTPDAGRSISAETLLQRIKSGDLDPNELLLGVGNVESELAESFRKVNVPVQGVRAAAMEATKRINDKLGMRGEA